MNMCALERRPTRPPRRRRRASTVHDGRGVTRVGRARLCVQVLRQGRADVVRLATPHRPEAVLDRLSQGDFVGEWGLISGEAALLAARATEPGLLHEIPRKRFLKLLAEDGEPSRVIMREMRRN